MAKMGRPTDYSPELVARLCAELSQGKSLRTVTRNDDMPALTTIFRWLSLSNAAEWAQDFRDQYARAKEEAADAMADEVLHISDTPVMGETRTIRPDGSVEVKQDEMLGHRRLQIDTRKWLMAKMKPKKYGERIQHANDEDNPMPAPIFGGASAPDKP